MGEREKIRRSKEERMRENTVGEKREREREREGE